MDRSFYQGKRVFITGHTGFKGTWLTRMLLAAGAEVSGYALEAETPSLFQLTGTTREMRSIIGDVRDRDALLQAVAGTKPDIVLHLAAQPLVRLSYDRPAYTYETNVMGTVNVLEALRPHAGSIRSFVNVTTDKVYENKERRRGYTEDETLCGRDPHSNSKSCSELVTHSYRLSFFNFPDAPAIATARSGNVIGGGDFAKDRLVPDCIRAVTEGREIIIRSPDSIRPYQHVLDCLAGYLLLAQRLCERPALAGSYNFGPDEASCVTTRGLVEKFCKAWGPEASWHAQDDHGPHEATFLQLNATKAKQALGWKPLWSVDKAVAAVVDWHKEVAEGGNATAATDRQISAYQTDASR